MLTTFSKGDTLKRSCPLSPIPSSLSGKKAKAKGKKPTAQKKDTSQAGIAGLKPTVGTQFREQLVNLMEMIR